MPYPRGGERVLGPYEHRDGWRIVVYDATGERIDRVFTTWAEASGTAKAAREEIAQRSTRGLGESIDDYELYLRHEKENRSKSWKETTRRLRRFFPDHDLVLSALTEKTCSSYYKRLTETLAVDSHRNMLAEAKSFFRWCVARKWIGSSPLEQVKGIGRRKHGKPQLGIDEARAWLDCAIAHADKGEEGAIAAMMTFVLNFRASEIVGLDVRDLDDGGALLWIRKGKTAAALRRARVPDFLQGYLLKLVDGRAPEEPLFIGRYDQGPRYVNGRRDRAWPRKWVQRICREVGVPVVTAHGMRGTHSTIAEAEGATGEFIALAMGHESKKTTRRSYTRPEAVQEATAKRALAVIQGGKGA